MGTLRPFRIFPTLKDGNRKETGVPNFFRKEARTKPVDFGNGNDSDGNL